MKKRILVIGIIAIAAGAVGIAMGGLFGYASVHTLDGTMDLYNTQRMCMFCCLTGGAVLLASGIVCLLFRRKYI